MNTTSNGRSRLPTTEMSDELRQALGRFSDLPLASRSTLEALIAGYADDIERAATKRGDLDVHLADCIARSCMTLLNEEWDRAEDSGNCLLYTSDAADE